MPLSGIAFNAFGTLFDLGGLRERVEATAPERGGELYDAFFSRLLPFTWHATLTGHYRPFPEMADAALLAAAQELGVDMPPERREEALGALSSLPAASDAAEALDGVAHLPLAVLSNGTTDGIRALVEGAGIEERFDHLLAADEVRRFKPAPEVYALATEAFGAPAEEVLLVSGNAWDVAGAKIAGLRTAWVSHGRPKAPFLGIEGDLVVRELAELPSAIGPLESG